MGFWVSSLITIGTGLFTLALIPQLIRTIKLGRADDISAPFILMVWVASCFTFAYWIIRGEWIASVGFAANIIAWGVIGLYRFKPRVVLNGS